MSKAATNDNTREFMVNDVRRAYFDAEITRYFNVEIPKGDSDYGRGDKVGRLRLCLYGTRDAALNRQETLSGHLINIGYERGVGFPNVCVHPEKDLWTLVHRDDYFSAGSKESLDWLEEQLKQRYEIKSQRICHDGDGSVLEGQILNRVVRATG